MKIQAVITADIVNSTKINVAREKRLIKSLQDLFKKDIMEFYRGDSFQACIKQPAAALRLALLCRTAAISLSQAEEKSLADIRISIGIGAVNTPVNNLKTAKGEAFLLSGRNFDEIAKTKTRLVIATANKMANEGLAVISDYVNSIFEKMTGKQAEVIFLLLQGEMQQSVAEKLKKTKSTIHQRLISARWPEIEKLITQYENIINYLL